MIATRAEILIYLGKSSSITDQDLALLDLVHRASDAAVRGYLQQELQYRQHVELLPIGQPVPNLDAVQEPYLRSDGAAVGFAARAGAGTDALQLKHLPVFEGGLEVREDVGANAGQHAGAFADATILNRGTDYWLDIDQPGQLLSRTGLLYRLGHWPTEPRSVKVTYYGGLTASQLNNEWADIKLAATIACAEEFQIAKRRQGPAGGPVQSESIGKYSYSLGGSGAAVASDGGYVLPHGVKARLFRHRNLGRLFG